MAVSKGSGGVGRIDGRRVAGWHGGGRRRTGVDRAPKACGKEVSAARRRGARSIAPEGDFLVGSHYLHVADDRPVGVVDELDADLRHVTGVTGAPEDAVNLSELDWLIHVDWGRSCKIDVAWRGSGGREGDRR